MARPFPLRWSMGPWLSRGVRVVECYAPLSVWARGIAASPSPVVLVRPLCCLLPLLFVALRATSPLPRCAACCPPPGTGLYTLRSQAGRSPVPSAPRARALVCELPYVLCRRATSGASTQPGREEPGALSTARPRPGMYAIPSGVSPGVSFLPTERIARPFPPILLFPERRTVWRLSFHEWYTSGHPRLAIPRAMSYGSAGCTPPRGSEGEGGLPYAAPVLGNGKSSSVCLFII